MIGCPFAKYRAANSIPTAVIANPLSLRLKAETSEAHRRVESRLGLPESISNIAGYRDCLTAFYRLYHPLEKALAQFQGWSGLGIELAARTHAPRLRADLTALGVDVVQLSDAPASVLPRLSSFAHAVGALYVLEGSTLGSQIILRHLRGVLGEEIAGADSFFAGHGQQTGTLWNSFRTSLDAYGWEYPESIPNVIEGAVSTFTAVGDWMSFDSNA
jgi:heme oxygenase